MDDLAGPCQARQAERASSGRSPRVPRGVPDPRLRLQPRPPPPWGPRHGRRRVRAGVRRVVGRRGAGTHQHPEDRRPGAVLPLGYPGGG